MTTDSGHAAGYEAGQMTISPITAETRWETYTEAAARLGITPEAVRAHAKRQRWPRQRPTTDPNGQVLIAIPADFRPARTRPLLDPDQTSGQPAGQSTGQSPANDAWRAALGQAEQRVVMADGQRLAAEERVRRSEARADRAEQRADAAERRTEQADADRRAADGRADTERTRAEQADVSRWAAESRAD